MIDAPDCRIISAQAERIQALDAEVSALRSRLAEVERALRDIRDLLVEKFGSNPGRGTVSEAIIARARAALSTPATDSKEDDRG